MSVEIAPITSPVTLPLNVHVSFNTLQSLRPYLSKGIDPPWPPLLFFKVTCKVFNHGITTGMPVAYDEKPVTPITGNVLFAFDKFNGLESGKSYDIIAELIVTILGIPASGGDSELDDVRIS